MEIKLFNEGMEKLKVEVESKEYQDMLEKLKVNKSEMDFVLFEFLL